MAMEVDSYGALAFAYPHHCFGCVPLPALATPIVDDEEEDLAEFVRELEAVLEENGNVEEAADEDVYFRFAAMALALEAAMDEDGDEYQDRYPHDVQDMDES